MKEIARRFNQLPLQRKLMLIFSVTILVVCSVNIYMFTGLNQMTNAANSVYESNISLNELSAALEEIQDNMYSYLNTKSSDALEDYYVSEQNYRSMTEQLNDKTTDNELLLTEKNIRGISESYLVLTDSAVNAKRGRNIEQYRADYEQATEYYHYLNDTINGLNVRRFVRNSSNYSELNDMQHSVEVLDILFLVLAMGIDLLLLLLVSARLTKPLEILAQRANEIRSGNFNVEEIAVSSDDEFRVVATAFNKMILSLQENIRRIRSQMEEESRLKEERLLMAAHLKDAQLGALQAQINPHFLYNTLNAGAQLSMMEGAEQTYLFLENVADFFRYNMRKSGRNATLSEEIQQVENYVYIMNTRYAGEIDFHRSVPERLPKLTLPSMVLQPLAENALEHGLRSLEGNKSLTLTVREEAERYVVAVSDNGVGMSAAQISSLMAGVMEEPTGQEKHGIGLRNVIARLRLYYGREDIFEIVSPGTGLGTEVRIMIPKEETEVVSDYAGG